MRHVVLVASVLAGCVIGSAQTMVLSTTSMTFSGRAGFAYPFSYSLYPAAQLFTINKSGTGTLTWSASITGPLSTACGGSACFALTGERSGTPATKGTAP